MGNNTIWKLSRIFVPQSLRWKLKQNVLTKYEKKPEMSKDDRLILEKFYRTDVKKLQLLLKKELPWTLVNSG